MSASAILHLKSASDITVVESNFHGFLLIICFEGAWIFWNMIVDFDLQLAHLAEMEVKHRCNQVLELGFPLGGLAKLFAQEWEGDVTVVMPATLAQVD